MDHLYKGMDKNVHFRILICDTKDLCIEAIKRHDCYPTSGMLLSKALTIGALMQGLEKDCNGITIKIKGDGPCGLILIDSSKKGTVRGYIDNPGVDLVKKNQLDDIDAIGTGLIEVVKDYNDNIKEPFVSSSPLQTGDLAKDFALYYTLSEQTPTFLNLACVMGDDKELIKACGGIMVQALPNTPEEEIKEMEERLKAMPSLTDLLLNGTSLSKIGQYIAPDYTVFQNAPLKFFCPCSKENFARGIITLGKHEIQDIINEDGKAEVICHYCKKAYTFSKEELEGLAKVAK